MSSFAEIQAKFNRDNPNANKDTRFGASSVGDAKKRFRRMRRPGETFAQFKARMLRMRQSLRSN